MVATRSRPSFSCSVVFVLASALGCTQQPPGGASDAGRTSGDDCRRDSDCLSGHCPVLPNEPRACRDECRADRTCDRNFACTRVDNAFLCLPIVDQLATGNICQGSRQCQSGTCASLGGADAGVCVDPCPEDETCPTNTTCSVDNTLALRAFCTPPLDSRAGGEDCTNGRECSGGRCMAWGGRTQCAGSCRGGCFDGGVCITQEDNGQACLPLLGAGDVCGNSGECLSGNCYAVDAGGVCVAPCGPDRHCPAGLGCTELEGSETERCIPLRDDKPEGETCGGPLDCASGRCAHFSAGSFDAGSICAAPCDAGACGEGQVCWGFNADAGSRGLCGPRPF
ncbi:MAG: hypothetical protein AB2A00_34600 [Myxococcota bacterium]